MSTQEEASSDTSAATVEPVADLEAVRAAVEAADEAFNRAARGRDQSSFRDLLAKDAIFLADEVQKGRLSFLTMWQPLFDGKYDFRYEAQHLETHLAQSGDLAWTLGTAVTRFTRPGTDTEVVTDSFYLSVWAPNDEGKWLLRISSSLVVHPTLGSARDPKSGLMTAWPELADQIGSQIDVRWTPEKTVRAASGEMAYTFGEYEASFEAVPSNDEIDQSGKGHFVSLWKKDDQGRWQLMGEGYTPPGIYHSTDG